MSLLIAKRTAELKDEFESLDKETAEKIQGFRTKIRESVRSEFTTYMEEQGFTVHQSAELTSASYRSLVVALKFSDEPMMGSFDYFNILVDGQPRHVLVAAAITGETRPSALPEQDEVTSWEHRIDAMKSTRDNIKLDSYSFVFAPKGSRHPASTLPELLDLVLAFKG